MYDVEAEVDIVAEHRIPIIAFVWRPEEIIPSVIQMAARTGSRAIFDFSMMGTKALHSFLRKADTAGHVRDIKISATTLIDPSFRRLLQETSVENIWVECHPQFFGDDISTVLQRLRELSGTHNCFPIVGDLDLLAEILKACSGIGRIVLKGCEASGFVSAETTQMLYSASKAMLSTSSQSPDIVIWGGISTPEASAAFLSTGAAGIVFESIHWLTDLVSIDHLKRQRLAKLRLDSTNLVGLDVQVPYRLFNKGNSFAVREIKTFEDSLCGAEITEESRRSFVSHVYANTLHPLESRFSQDEVIPLGVEAAFAASFVKRFGTGTEESMKVFLDGIRNLCRLAEKKKDCFLASPVATEMGTTYPFIQGAMASITDVPEFASKVADAGGLPTIALGLMDEEALERKLGRLTEIMKGRPYAVNIISLAENPYRQMHLAWIKKHRPRFVWIAGGDLSSIRELLECGIEVMYIAPDEALLRLAIEAGVRYVVCEGYEAGGHVGPNSTLTLAQMILDLKQREPLLFQDSRVILAGGIFSRETAFIAAMLGADAIQMGTAYLATSEIIETGALTALYQRMIVESAPGGTVVSGQDTGLRVRSLNTPVVAAVLALEREFAAGHQDEHAFRARIEEMTAGSLWAAARGMDRQGDVALDEQACIERGQFMSGACAGLVRKVQNLHSFHRELAEGPLVLQCKVPSAEASHRLKRVPPSKDAHERIVITGMSIINALGKSPEEVWSASLAMKSGITLVPPSRWDHGLYYDPRPRVPDKTYCNVGAFVDFNVSRNELGIPPQDFRTMTSSTKITMWLADKAIKASGLLNSNIPRERIGVLISQNSGEAAGTLTNTIIRAYVHDILAAVNRAVHLTPDQKSAIEREVKSGRMAPDDTTLMGRLNCAAAGFICNQYGLMGPSYAVSAACATSLVALHSAVQMIRNGIIDAAIVGGGEDNLTHLHFLEFSALGALYGLSGQERSVHETSRPFEAERDGMVLGEGGGMIVIERENLARSRGAFVHAFVTGMGASNNHLGMVESSSITQEMAIRASFQGLPYGPDAVDLVECHATSTRQGDVEESRALKSVFNFSKRTVITSFKSQIGHTLGASGVNSLIRGVMAMKAEIFPPTLNYTHPDPEIDLEGSGLLIAKEPLDWKRRAGQPRRLQVNAFGFGGSNYVVQVEQAMDEADTILVSPGIESGLNREQGEGSPELQGVSFFRTEIDGRNYRMAVIAQSEGDALSLIGRSAFIAEAGVLSPKVLRSLAQQGIFIGRENMPGLPIRPLAFVFPGQGSQYAGMGQDLYESFPVIREWMDRAAAAADFDLLHLMFHDREENLQKTRWQQPAMFAMENAVARYLTTLGIHPVAMAGHSLGELTALCLAGVYSPEDGFRIVNKRALCMDKAAAMNVEPGIMAAVDAPLDLLREMIQGRENVYIGNINSPTQVILSGGTEAVRDLGKTLKEMGYRCTLLRVSMAFHSPIMKVIHDELEAYIASIPFHPPQIPVISNTTMAPYPSDIDEIKRILMAHLESTVQWMNNVQTLWNDYGIKHFVEVGPGETLSNLIADTLPEAACIQTCLSSAEGLTCKTALAQLFVQGHLKVEREARFVSLAAFRKVSASGRNTPIGEVSSAICEAVESQDLMERLIQIIMDATGFEREEIQPDMDLRKDLSIRSSRLPIIMDAAERQFGISIEFEDLIGARTVKDIAQSLSRIIAAQGGTSLQSATKTVGPEQVVDEILRSSEKEARLKRLVIKSVHLELSASAPIEMISGETVLCLSPDGHDGIVQNIGNIFQRDYGVDTIPMLFMKVKGTGQEGYDILTDEGACRASERMSSMASLAGMVITLPEGGSERLRSMADVSRLLRGFFLLLKAFIQSPTKKFVVLIHSGEDTETPGRLLAEGMLGLFLSAAQEQPSVQFRVLEIGRDTDLRLAVLEALDRGYTAVEMARRDGSSYAPEWRLDRSVFNDSSTLNLSPGDVIVMSGGATGISAHLARSLVPFMPRLVFLGRTSLDSGINRALEIARNLADLHAEGIEATYHACDVTDPEAVRMTMREVISRYGKIDGIIHGAGILRDGFLSQMTPDDFSMVTDVKFLGAWNLFSASEGAGLRFFVGLSSVAAIQGNPGQANYAAANRMMSALLSTLRRKNSAIRFKALMLPPIEGTGMAEDPEVRELLKRKGVDYIHINEFAGLFCRELFSAPNIEDWVMFMRRLPSVKTALINDTAVASLNAELDGGTVSLSPEDFPMIESISCLDLRREELEVFRSFSLEKDLWIADHRPFKFVKHPLVSAAMILETFMETARILYPHLRVRGVRHVQLMEMIQCPVGVSRPSRIFCHRAGTGHREVVCEVSLATQDISPSGRLTDRLTSNCKGQVILDGGGENLGEGLPDFPVRLDELRTGPMDNKKVLKWYNDRSGLEGRYRVLEALDGAGLGVVRGRTIYREISDFANLRNARYQYSPYLFEALLQLVGFHVAAMDPSERRSLIPIEIGEMRFLRKCREREQITLEARMLARDEEGLVWNARGLDEQGRAIMQVNNLRMHWGLD